MEKDLIKLSEILNKKLPSIVDAIEKADATSEEYNKLLTNFNSSMVIYSEIQNMFASRMQQNIKVENNEEVKEDGSNN